NAGDFGPGPMYLELPLPDGIAPIRLRLDRAQIKGTFAAGGITQGLLCGAIPVADVAAILFPAAADLLSAEVKRGNQTYRDLFDTDHSCTGDPACTPTSREACHCISVDEAQHNSILRSLLAPDVDLDLLVDNPFEPDPDSPYHRNDHLSVAVGFEAATAEF